MPPISYSRHRFPPMVIQHAVWSYLRFTLSFRDVEPDELAYHLTHAADGTTLAELVRVAGTRWAIEGLSGLSRGWGYVDGGDMTGRAVAGWGIVDGPGVAAGRDEG